MTDDVKISSYWKKRIIAVWCARIMLFIPLHGMVTMLYFIKLIKVFYAKEWVQAHSLILCLKYDKDREVAVWQQRILKKRLN